MKGVVLWTGAGQIGMAIVRRIGYGKVIIVGDKKLANAERAAKTLTEAGFSAVAMEADISSRESVLNFIDAGLQHGDITALVNSAGVSPSQASVETILKVDLYGTAMLLEEVGRVIKKGGVGVTISSQSGYRLPALGAKVDEKLALTPTEELLDLDFLQPEKIRDSLQAYQLAKRCNVKRVMAEAVKWSERGARLNSISPGIIVTPLAIDEFNGQRGEFYKNMFAKCPAGRPGTADEVANLAEFLMSERGAYVTGSDFLIDGGATASYFYGPLRPKAMKYRDLGKTGLKVSEIGMGCEGFNEDDGNMTFPLMECAQKYGVNFIDLYSPNPTLRSNLGKALQGKRDKFILQAHLCTIWKNGQYERTRKIKEVKQGFEDLLERLETDYIDIGMIHYVDSLEDWQKVAEGGVLDYALELKAQGKIKHIGLSSHNPVAAQKAVESGKIEVLTFSVNPCYDLQPASENCEDLWAEDSYKKTLTNMDPDREKLYETCQRLGVGITVMKVFGGGDLLTDDSPAGKALTVEQCIHYALARPAVATVLVGAHSVAELERSVKYETATDAEKDYAEAFAAFPKINWTGHCMYCGHCAPCTKSIDIATVTKFLNLAKAQKDVPETVREHYNALKAHGGDCIECGACEKRCPFGVKIIENMHKAKCTFEK